MKSVLLYITVFLLVVLVSKAQRPYLIFETQKIGSRISETVISSIVQDSVGFLWLGTASGIFRYDGQDAIKINKTTDGNIENITVNVICIEKNRYLWIGTQNNGLYQYDIKTQTLVNYLPKVGNNETLIAKTIACATLDKYNRLWIGTHNGLQMLDLNKSSNRDTNSVKFQTYKAYQHPNTIPSDSISGFAYNDSFIWVATTQGLASIDLKHNEPWIQNHNFTKIFQPLAHQRIYMISVSPDNVLWAITLRDMCSINLINNKLTTFNISQIFQIPMERALGGIFTNYIHDQWGNTWVGIAEGGLWQYNNKTWNLFSKQNHNAQNEQKAFIGILLYDKEGSMWMGVGKSRPNNINFGWLRYNDTTNYALSSESIRGITEDHQGNIWIAGYPGLDKVNKNTYQTTSYIQSDNSFIHIFGLHFDSQNPNILWLASELYGLASLNVENKKLQVYTERMTTYTIVEQEQYLWIGAYEGLLKFDKNSKKIVTKYIHNQNNPTSVAEGEIKTICIDKQKRMWVGTQGGLCLFLPETQTFQRYRYDEKNTNSLINNRIRCIYESSLGDFWVGTDGGLALFNRQTGACKNYTIANGLPDNMIYGILEDDNRNLWLSTNKGLSRFDPRTEEFINFDKNFGLQDNEFNTGSYFKDANGIMYFGGLHGITYFNPNKIALPKQLPNVVFTDFKLFNESVTLDTIKDGRVLLTLPIESTKNIELNYNDKFLSFEFVCLDFINPNAIRYAYMLEGWNDKWIYTDASDRVARFSSLPVGEYKLRVKATNSYGQWNANEAVLIINVMPPWWQTWWARTLLIISIILFMVGFVWVRLRNTRIRQKELELQIQTATSEIVAQKDALEQQAESIKQLATFKESMTGMIVHDMKNLLGSIIYQPSDNDLIKKLQTTQQAGRQILNMVLNILDVQKYEEARLQPEILPNLLYNTASTAIEQVIFTAQQKQISIDNNIAVNIAALYDADLVERVFVNLLTNAIKFTSAQGNITISCHISQYSCICMVSDTGKGIPADKLPYVFDKFVQVENQKHNKVQSTGLGLTFCKLTIEAHGGKIWVESTPDKGTTFYFTLQLSAQKIQTELKHKLATTKTPTETLQKEEKMRLLPIARALKKVPYYQISDVRRIVSNINEEDTVPVQNWKYELQQAVYNSNEQHYHNLINMVE